jgi:hypothetical protein
MSRRTLPRTSSVFTGRHIFVEAETGAVTCRYCSRTFATSTSTSTLKKHINHCPKAKEAGVTLLPTVPGPFLPPILNAQRTRVKSITT